MRHLSPISIWCFAISAVCGGAMRAQAQDAPSRVTATAVLMMDGDADRAIRTTTEIGIRRGAGEVTGVRYVHPGDILSSQQMPDDVRAADEERDRIAEVVLSEEPAILQDRLEVLVDVYESNLEVIRRANLADLYVLRGVARCRAGESRGCRSDFLRVLTFREGMVYDLERYPEEYAPVFEEMRELSQDTDRGSIEVVTEPAGVEVFIDGRSYGASPAVAEGLLVGDHYITVKAFGYEKVIERANVGAEQQESVFIELLRNERSLLVENDLPRIRGELGEPRAGRFTQGLQSNLYVNQVVLGVVRPVGQDVEVSLYLYDLRTNFLLARRRGTIPSGPDGIPEARRLTVALYDGVDLSGAVEAPDDAIVHEEPSTVFEKWWFWTAVGAVVVSGIVAYRVLDTESGGIPEGWTRIDGQIR